MPIFYCHRNLFSQAWRVYPSHKTILNCFARQSTTCPYSIVIATCFHKFGVSTPLTKQYCFHKFGVSTPLTKQYLIVLFGRVPHAHILLSICFGFTAPRNKHPQFKLIIIVTQCQDYIFLFNRFHIDFFD